MLQSKSMLGVVLAVAMLSGCGTNQVASTLTPPSVSSDASLKADEAALGPDAAAAAPTFAVQQAGYGMRTNDNRIRLAMGMGDGDRMRIRYDHDDDRLRRLHPRVSYVFNRYPGFFHNAYGSQIYTLRPTVTLVVLRRLFPELDDAALLMLLERLYIIRNLNVYHQSFPVFFRPFVVRRHYVRPFYGGFGHRGWHRR